MRMIGDKMQYYKEYFIRVEETCPQCDGTGRGTDTMSLPSPVGDNGIVYTVMKSKTGICGRCRSTGKVSNDVRLIDALKDLKLKGVI